MRHHRLGLVRARVREDEQPAAARCHRGEHRGLHESLEEHCLAAGRAVGQVEDEGAWLAKGDEVSDGGDVPRGSRPQAAHRLCPGAQRAGRRAREGEGASASGRGWVGSAAAAWGPSPRPGRGAARLPTVHVGAREVHVRRQPTWAQAGCRRAVYH